MIEICENSLGRLLQGLVEGITLALVIYITWKIKRIKK